MFFLTYMLAELRQRSGRTVLTALGLGLGVGLVVTANALSTGLDRAQAAILEPLTGVGTNMSVSRPIDLNASDSGGFPQLSEEERQQLRDETAVAVSGSAPSASRASGSRATASSLRRSSRSRLPRWTRSRRSTASPLPRAA